jgi:hypothetical protein
MVYNKRDSVLEAIEKVPFYMIVHRRNLIRGKALGTRPHDGCGLTVDDHVNYLSSELLVGLERIPATWKVFCVITTS